MPKADIAIVTIIPEEYSAVISRLGRFPDRESAIVRVCINGLVEGISRDEAARELRRLFPRLHEIKWEGHDAPDESDAHTIINPHAGFETNIRDWLNASLEDDPDKENLLALAETFMAEGRAA